MYQLCITVAVRYVRQVAQSHNIFTYCADNRTFLVRFIECVHYSTKPNNTGLSIHEAQKSALLKLMHCNSFASNTKNVNGLWHATNKSSHVHAGRTHVNTYALDTSVQISYSGSCFAHISSAEMLNKKPSKIIINK